MNAGTLEKGALHIVLFEPQIPQNTGNIGRMCAITGAVLHLIEPLGFKIEDRHLRRSGMDYWQALDVRHHTSWEAFLTAPNGPARLWLFTTKAECSFWDIAYQKGDGLLFGNETSGAPEKLHTNPRVGRVTIPQFTPSLRSLNLSTAAGIATYEAIRQVRC